VAGSTAILTSTFPFLAIKNLSRDYAHIYHALRGRLSTFQCPMFG
jgi:hypothetical protein